MTFWFVQSKTRSPLHPNVFSSSILTNHSVWEKFFVPQSLHILKMQLFLQYKIYFSNALHCHQMLHFNSCQLVYYLGLIHVKTCVKCYSSSRLQKLIIRCSLSVQHLMSGNQTSIYVKLYWRTTQSCDCQESNQRVRLTYWEHQDSERRMGSQHWNTPFHFTTSTLNFKCWKHVTVYSLPNSTYYITHCKTLQVNRLFLLKLK